jgi:hypothetical protein
MQWLRERVLADRLISPEDLELFLVTDSVSEAVAHVNRYRQAMDASDPP